MQVLWGQSVIQSLCDRVYLWYILTPLAVRTYIAVVNRAYMENLQTMTVIKEGLIHPLSLHTNSATSLAVCAPLFEDYGTSRVVKLVGQFNFSSPLARKAG